MRSQNLASLVFREMINFSGAEIVKTERGAYL